MPPTCRRKDIQRTSELECRARHMFIVNAQTEALAPEPSSIRCRSHCGKCHPISLEETHEQHARSCDGCSRLRTSAAWSRAESRFGASRNSASAFTLVPCMAGTPTVEKQRIRAHQAICNRRRTATLNTRVWSPFSSTLGNTFYCSTAGQSISCIVCCQSHGNSRARSIWSCR